MALRNRSTVPQGMLAPAGIVDTPVDPAIQSTTRPPGVLLPPSPGYDSVRVGKNRFQGKGPTGGFRRMEFAEDLGGTGAALSAVPGETSMMDASEWLPDARGGSVREGSIIIADREHNPGTAVILHEAYNTIPDMGDRTASRPFSKAWWHQMNPASVLKEEYGESPAIAVVMGLALVGFVYLVAGEFERQYKGGKNLGSDVTSPASAASRTGGDVTGDAIDKIGNAADQAVTKIENAGDRVVSKIDNAASNA